jgi:regulator of sigma E protease
MIQQFFGSAETFLLYLLAFLFVLTVVVFIHELGHFLVARWCGVRVQVFSIGFGREIWGFVDRHGTRWRIAWIPLGGYVKFIDDEGVTSSQAAKAKPVAIGADGGAEPALIEVGPTGTASADDGSFHGKPVWKRAAVVAAGPLANFLLAIVIFAVNFVLFGQRTTVPRIDKVMEGTPAYAAGLKDGDIIRAIDGRKIGSFNDVLRTVTTGGGRELRLTVERAGASVDVTVRPLLQTVKDDFGLEQSVWRIGIMQSRTPEITTDRNIGPLEAVVLGVRETGFIITSTLSYLGDVVTMRQKPDQLGGPARIADIAGKVAKRSMFDLIYLAAFISVSVGLVNLFPIPLLDGGHLLFYAIEATRGRPLSDRTQEMSFRIGMAVVLTLMVFSFWNDRFIMMRWLTGAG